jgi:hypothetical protein
VVASSSSGVEILKQQGFATLDTFQKLMDSASLQEVAREKIVWIDEAGFLSTRQMRWAVDFAARNDCRLILSGDTRQHHAVERGDAMVEFHRRARGGFKSGERLAWNTQFGFQNSIRSLHVTVWYAIVFSRFS